MKSSKVLFWILQIIVAVILLQSLFFKFTGQPVSVELFSSLGVEPFGRFLVGIIELAAGIMLFVPKTVKWGAISSAFVGFGAIITHIFFIGIIYDGDISLFLMAIVVFVLSLIVWIFRNDK